MLSDSFQKIQLFLACRNLKDLDFFSKSDPYIKISWRRDFNHKNFLPLGKTQTINNNLNPTFSKSFVVDYIFQSRQDIHFQVFDDDNGNDDFIGSIDTTIGTLMGAKNQTSILDLKKNGKNMGKLIVRCQPITQSGEWYQMKWKAKKLMNTDSFFDFWDKSDPYLKFLKIRNDNSMLQALKTEIIKDNLNPNWKPFQIQSSRLHQQNNGRFKLQCWDWQQSGKDQFIGQIYLDIKDIKINSNYPKEFPLTNVKHKKPGTLLLQKFRSFQKPTFVDYIRGGLQLNMIIAIDFTASNGIPKAPTSLHYMDSFKPNQYQMAIGAVGQILLNYDSDKRIPAFGFGAKTHFPNLNTNLTNHCFPLSGNFNQLDSFGIQHLMQLYSQALKSVQLAGPTYFAPIIEEVAKLSYSCKQNSIHIYQTLLILTDGQIHDMDKTIDLIVQSTNLPLSIIIVGIGQANFNNMERLDGDNGLFDSHGRKAQRDIVQFVPFRQVKYNPDVLAQNLLAQLPNQVVQYFQSIGVPPKKPSKQVNLSQMMPINQQQYTKQQVQQIFNKANFFSKENQINPYGQS